MPTLRTAAAWDAAISFLDGDLATARRIAKLLDGRATVFVYANHPERLVGGDGVETFSAIYGRDATLVVVLYREGWGETGWTSIEKTAINSRRVTEKTDDFLMVVKMEDVTTPPWLSAARIYGTWNPLGAKGVAGAIVARLQELGKRVCPESALDVARRIAAEAEWQGKRESFLYSPAGRDAARQQAENVFVEMETLTTGTECSFYRDRESATVLRGRFFMTVAVTSHDGRNLQLMMQLWDGELLSVRMPVGNVLDRRLLTFDIEPPDVFGWRESSRFLTSAGVADAAVTLVLKEIERKSRR